MAKAGEEDVDYESDPEEEKRLLGMRRREAASDDEEGEGEGKGEDERVMDRRGPIHSDEPDGLGGAAEYDEDEEEEDDDELEEEEEEEEEEVYEDDEEEVYEEAEGYAEEEESDRLVEGKEGNEERGSGARVEVEDNDMEGRNVEDRAEVRAVGNHVEEGEEGEDEGEGDEEEGKKENEPFAVPTAGAFYMHDDRFRDNTGGRHRRTYGGRKLWESKDDKKWGHDKFEEMSLQERHYEQGRRASRGNYRARGGKNRGPDRGYAKRNRSKAFSNGNNQKQEPKSVKGRGPRRYEHLKNSSQAPPAQNKQHGKALEKTSHGSSGRVFSSASNTESEQVPPARKHSSLNSASPPFYPSASSNKDITLTQKRDIQAASTSKSLRGSGMDENFSMQQTNALMRGKNVANSVGIEKLYIDDSITAAAGKPLNNMQMQPSGSSVGSNSQPSQSRAQGRSVAIPGQMTYQPTQLHNQVNRVSTSIPVQAVPRNPQNRVQPSVQSPGQQFSQLSGSGSHASSPPKTALSINSYDSGEVETTSESGKSKNALVGKGKSAVQGSGRGSFLYGGAQVMGATGNMGVGHGDQNFPAFWPVMQFGGQHPGGIGVPAVGMAFPGYVAQPQLGLGNSEMTWLPVLTGAAGALGPTYGSPYLAVDGTYHTRPSGQTAALSSSSKENNTNKANNEWKPSQRPEVVTDEFGQRQKPRRYSEMDFKQPSTST